MSSFYKDVLKSMMPPKTLASHGQGNRRGTVTRNRNGLGKQDFTPVAWNKYFKETCDISLSGNSFRVYTLGESGPLLVLLHGGGFSALTWAVLGTTLVKMVHCRILAIDMRGHGDTVTQDDTDLSIGTLTDDVVGVVERVAMGEGVVLVGHSMGGAVAVHVASSGRIAGLLGLIVIDVVEGTAIGSLAAMQGFLRSRPQSFTSVEHAIRWSLQSGQLKNFESARVSVPGQIKNVQTGKTATTEAEDYRPVEESTEIESHENNTDTIKEDEEATFKMPNKCSAGYTWRVDLCRTEVFWHDWFSDLSNMFLQAPAQKLLLLANLDRLDTNLTVGQMQGKFEMHAFETVRGRCGHAVHEDVPDAVAQVIAAYLVRNKFAVAKEAQGSP